MSRFGFIKIYIIILVVSLSSCTKSTKVFSESDIQIIPQPAELNLGEGVFEFTKNTKFVSNIENKLQFTNVLIDKFYNTEGWNLETTIDTPTKNYVEFVQNTNLEKEEYLLSVTPNKITISAKNASGFMFGLETVRQLLPVEIESKEKVSNVKWIIPVIEIKDEPRFQYRGLHLDVARHFFKKEYIKQTIDRLAMLKMNVLHLHLVDDQGWRIEIKKYPKLTEVGAFRLDQEELHWDGRKVTTPEDEATYGGFYTQEDIKEIVAYATARGIDIIPEIEMPAHVMSAIAAYPELSCFETPIGVPSGGVWPITEIYCAGKDSTFEFLENVLLEVMELFPSKYIHIGGDEATKTNWAKCPHCQKRMQTEGLENVEELQSYFVKRMEKFINSKNKNLIGWDEILEGGLAPEATVMSWRGVRGGIEAAKQGHDVIMTPGTHCYFDHYQGPQNEEPLAWGGYSPLSKVYEFDPIVDELTEAETNHILGGQANLWSEYIQTEAHSEYMIFPRLAALSEALWSPKNLRDWDSFSRRVNSMFERYELLGINYAKSAYLVMADTQINLKENTVEVLLTNEFPNSDIRYSLDGSALKSTSKKYLDPIKISETTILKASLFENNKPIGKEFNETIKFHKAVGKKVSFKEIYDENYQGSGAFNMTNTLRGTKNFHDGQWQAWLVKDMEAVINLEKEIPISEVTIGSMENQGSGIYYPTKIEVFVSSDGEHYNLVGNIERAYAKNAGSELKDFKIEFSTQKTQYVKVVATNLKQTPEGGDAWLFISEILID